MLVTNAGTGTNICEVAAGLHRIDTPVALPDRQFPFDQCLLLADGPLLFHTGPRGLVPHVRDAVAGEEEIPSVEERPARNLLPARRPRQTCPFPTPPVEAPAAPS